MANAYKPFDAVEAVRTWTAQPKDRYNLAEAFGEMAFGSATMRKWLPERVHDELAAAVDAGEKPSAKVADGVAAAMKDWALSHGATHYTHVFHPLTGRTAEKHDSFIDVARHGQALTKFTGKQLMQGEPDASSFPSGGLRFTHEARGYTVWDPTSPAFILEGEGATFLCIPAIFVSWTGESLDKKVPLLRSVQALDRAARRALALFGDPEQRVTASLGPEQEYFLVDREFHYRRPDLVNSGRTLFGAKPPKGQELDDHYFGSTHERVLAFMQSVESDLFRLGVPMQTRHNEVAPQQFEFAPVYEDANVAADHQQLTMRVMERNAPRYGLVCLLHEKPFAGINGSGKHLNWSFGTKSRNLLDPGDKPHENDRFLFFCTAVMRAVERHQDLLLASVASAGNDHRLGANEAPPSIVSVYLGDAVQAMFERIAETGSAASPVDLGLLETGVATAPDTPRDASDRNRTSPFAFTGNKFEFRSPGSSMSISFPATVLNTIAAESIDELCDAIKARTGDGASVGDVLGDVLATEIARFRHIMFSGDNYAPEWVEEAARRGLVNNRNGAVQLPALAAEKNEALFDKYGVMSRRELRARFEVRAEQYVTRITTEALTTVDMARTSVLPAAVRYLGELGAAQRGDVVDGGRSALKSVARRVDGLVSELVAAADALDAALAHEGGEETRDHLNHVAERVVPAMDAVRAAADGLEGVVPDDLWPLPSYRDMIFVR